MKEKSGELNKLYLKALAEFQESGYHPHPANLLAMLLLEEKEEFETIRNTTGVFYRTYKDEIDSKIAKVKEDFHITKEEVEAFIEEKGIYTDDERFEYNQIWHVFAEGFMTMQGEMMYRPNQSAYSMYNKMDNKSKLYTMTPAGLKECSVEKRIKVFSKK